METKKSGRSVGSAVVRGEVARALAAVRRARKAGATVRQLNKIVRTVLAEEAVEEVQNV